MAETRQFCTFYLDELLFGVDLRSVQEVIRVQHLMRVPLAPKAVTGLINLRGQIVTAMDLRQRLKLKAQDAAALPANVVVRSGDGPISLSVDRIGDVVEAEENNFEYPPETVPVSLRKVIVGVYKLDRQLMHVLDIDRACQIGDVAEAGMDAQ